MLYSKLVSLSLFVPSTNALAYYVMFWKSQPMTFIFFGFIQNKLDCLFLNNILRFSKA